jgi:hypothetical protein
MVFGGLYLVAMVLLLIGTFGLFGSPSGPLAGIFLVPLGIPWVFMLEGFSDTLKPWLAALAPGLNLVSLLSICRLVGRSMFGS